MTAKMKMMIQRTTIRLEIEATVPFMIVRISLRDFHDLASLKTLNSLKDLNMDKPLAPSARNSTMDKTTITKSKSFALS